MKKTIILGEPIGLEEFVAIARHHAQVEFSPEYCQRVEKSRALVETWVAEERVMYGEADIHYAWDFGASAQTPIYSVCDGTVLGNNLFCKYFHSL